MCVWCYIFTSRVSLKRMELFYEANTVSTGPVSHELYEKKISKKKLHSKSLILLDDKNLKTNLSIDFMIKRNFKILNETAEQVLLSY